jgi:hypothetical protein
MKMALSPHCIVLRSNSGTPRVSRASDVLSSASPRTFGVRPVAAIT